MTTRPNPKPIRLPKARYSPSAHRMTRCQSDCDGMCTWKRCPQLRDKEPEKTGRHCPLDAAPEGDES